MSKKDGAKSKSLIEQQIEGNPLLKKVRELLTQTDGAKWQVGGEDLTEESRFPHPREAYDQALIIDIPGASLVLHRSQPVKPTYLKGGYALVETGPAYYTVQVRDKIFNAERLVDPKFSSNWKGKRCDIVATGEIARTLFHEVYAKIKTFRVSQQKEFDERSRALLADLPHRIEELNMEAWLRNEAGTTIRFSTELEGIKVLVERAIDEFGYQYNITLQQEKHSLENKGSRLARALYMKLDEMSQQSELLKLSEVLKKAGF